MEQMDKKKHWENIYHTKKLEDASWYQPIPDTSLDFLKQYNIPLSAKIIDVGGGDSLLVDHLLGLGYQDITVLDISEAALERAKKRLGEKASLVKWIVADITTFKALEKYDFWHDRAAFHFLTDLHDIENYISIVREGLNPGGVLVIGTFSDQGPKKCSGIEIRQYSEKTMAEKLMRYFEKISCIPIEHITPSGTLQSFIFCSFRKPQSK